MAADPYAWRRDRVPASRPGARPGASRPPPGLRQHGDPGVGAGRSRLAGRPVGLARRAWPARPGRRACFVRGISPGADAALVPAALALANTTAACRSSRVRGGGRGRLGGAPVRARDRGRRRAEPRPRGRRCRPGARDARRDRGRGGPGRDVVAVQGVPQGHVRLDLLRPLAQPLLELVLDDDLRQPLEDCGLPAPKGHRVRSAAVRRRACVRQGSPPLVGRAPRRRRDRDRDGRPVGVLAGTKIAQDRSVSQAVDRIPAASRSVRAVWFGVPVGAAQAYPALDATVALEARRASGSPGRRRSCSSARARSRATSSRSPASTGLAPYVQLTSGRLPRTCTPARCEVLLLRGTGTLPNAPGLRLVRVGTGTLRSSQLFGDFLAPTDNALEDRELAPALQQGASYHRPAAGSARRRRGDRGPDAGAGDGEHVPQLRLGVAARRRPAAALGDRRPRLAERAGAGGALRRLDRLQRAGPRRGASGNGESATVAGRRLLLVGGEAAALLFAFAVLAARSMRRDLEAARRRLTWYGARRWQLRLLTVTESAIVAVAGAVDRLARRRRRRCAGGEPRGGSRRRGAP